MRLYVRDVTSETTTAITGIPIVCTMRDQDSSDQLLEWSDLQHGAKEVIAIEAGARMTLPASMIDQVRDLVQREAGCCAFLTLVISVAEDDLTLEVTAADPKALPVISVLAGIPLP